MSRSTGQTSPPATAWEANSLSSGSAENPVLLPLVNGEVSERTVEAARAIARGNETELIVVNAVSVPEQTPLKLPDRLLTEHWNDTFNVVETVEERDTSLPIAGRVHVGHRLPHIIADAAEKYDIGTTVWDDSWETSRLSPLTRNALEKTLADAECPVAVPTATKLPEAVHSVLVPVAGGPHTPMATRIAGSIARAHDAWIELLHVTTTDSPDRQEGGDQHLSAARNQLAETDNVDTWLLEAETAAEAIIEQSQYYDVTVIGAPRTPRLRRVLFGSTARTVQENAPSSLITVWRGQGEDRQ